MRPQKTRILLLVVLVGLLVFGVFPAATSWVAYERSLANIRWHGLGVLAYHAELEVWPETLARSFEFIPDEEDHKVTRDVFTNPRRGYSGYQYVQPSEGLDGDSRREVPILWEVRDDGTIDPDGCIGYADGHVEGPRDRSNELRQP